MLLLLLLPLHLGFRDGWNWNVGECTSVSGNVPHCLGGINSGCFALTECHDWPLVEDEFGMFGLSITSPAIGCSSI